MEWWRLNSVSFQSLWKQLFSTVHLIWQLVTKCTFIPHIISVKWSLENTSLFWTIWCDKLNHPGGIYKTVHRYFTSKAMNLPSRKKVAFVFHLLTFSEVYCMPKHFPRSQLLWSNKDESNGNKGYRTVENTSRTLINFLWKILVKHFLQNTGWFLPNLLSNSEEKCGSLCMEQRLKMQKLFHSIK